MELNPAKQSKIYKAASDELRKAAISSEIDAKMQFVKAAAKGNRTNLNDVEAVQQKTAEYMAACRESGSIPTIIGLSAALGVSRRWVNMFMQDHPETPTAQYLETVKSAFGDIMLGLALGRHISEPTAIFSMKNMADFVDKVEIEARPSDVSPLGPVADRKALEEKLADIVIDDDFES